MSTRGMFPHPKKRAPPVSVAVPASIVADVPHLREKTAKIGIIGRAAAMFRVQDILLYPDEHGVDQRGEVQLIANVLRYLATPPHLRKLAVRLDPSLRFVGVLPPLQTPNHPPVREVPEAARVGDFRDGWVLKSHGNESFVEVGLKASMVVGEALPRNSVVTVRIDALNGEIRGSVVDSSRIDIYWGYRVQQPNLPIGRLLKSQFNGMIISTSRYGRAIQEVLPVMKEQWNKSSHVTILFGSPKRGLYEIVRREQIDLDQASNFVVNTVPDQGVQTVRTEEAVLATLAILNASI